MFGPTPMGVEGWQRPGEPSGIQGDEVRVVRKHWHPPGTEGQNFAALAFQRLGIQLCSSAQ
jgi:hypothetical protein